MKEWQAELILVLKQEQQAQASSVIKEQISLQVLEVQEIMFERQQVIMQEIQVVIEIQRQPQVFTSIWKLLSPQENFFLMSSTISLARAQTSQMFSLSWFQKRLLTYSDPAALFKSSFDKSWILNALEFNSEDSHFQEAEVWLTCCSSCSNCSSFTDHVLIWLLWSDLSIFMKTLFCIEILFTALLLTYQIFTD